jgi:hypothetical protein
MSSAILHFSPVLNYLGAVDINCSQYGTTMYSVFYDSSISTLGNVLMFEYKYIQENVLVPNSTNVTFGFVSIENATNAGISNQWTIAIPAENYEYNPAISLKIAVRVYVGRELTSQVSVTEWSNELDVHNPPEEPVIQYAFYDEPSVDNDDLFVFLQDNPSYDSSINFVVAYYYQDLSGNTVWDVSTPLSYSKIDAIDNSANKLIMVRVSEFGTVSTDPSYDVVYTAVYAVYTFEDISGNKYYTVSHVSNTYNAEPTDKFNRPTITGVDYAVYGVEPSPVPGSQTMTVKWDPPQASIIPIYNVNYYNVYYSVNNDSSWIFLQQVAANLDLESDLNVLAYPCGTTIYFKVEAVSEFGTISPPSLNTPYSQLNKFVYAAAPTNLTVVTSNLVEDNKVDMSISFKNPLDTGCGEPLFFDVYVNGARQTTDNQIPYVDSSANVYSWSIANASFNQSGIVAVRLVTQDTNPAAPLLTVYPNRNGAAVSKSYIATNLELEPVDYNVYVDPNSQDMVLSWNSQSHANWSADYTVYKQIGSNTQQIYSGSGTSYTYDASSNPCNTTLTFYVVCNLTNTDSNIKTVTSNNESINMFRYALAPQNLQVITSVQDSSGNVDMTIQFKNPSNNGCGNPLYYNVYVNNVLQTVPYIIPYVDSSTNVYTWTFTDESFTQTGTVTVALVTADTNPGYNATDDREGASTSTPYIATNLTLDPVDYRIYDDHVQNMVLEWNAQGNTGGWLAATYKVYYVNVDASGNVAASGNYSTNVNSTYTYNASAVPCGNTMSFYVEATLVNGSTTFVVTSNTQSINMFRYASAPEVAVLWASTNAGENYMDIKAYFSTPDRGCGDFIKYVVKVNNAIGVLIAIKEIDVEGSSGTPNEVVFNDIQYAAQGVVEVYMVTEDTNPGYNPVTDARVGASGFGPYITTFLPIIRNIAITESSLTFNVITQAQLDLWGFQLTCIINAGDLLTEGARVVTGVFEYYSIALAVGPNNENVYSFSIAPGFLDLPVFESNIMITVSNNVGMTSRPAFNDVTDSSLVVPE